MNAVIPAEDKTQRRPGATRAREALGWTPGVPLAPVAPGPGVAA